MDRILKHLEEVNKTINSIVWGPAILVFLIFVGIYFSFRFHFFQVYGIKRWFFGTVRSFLIKGGEGSISPFQALTTSLAGAIGTGNIVGVATALVLGGPGAIFWMWVGAFFGMMTIFAENILGALYKQRNANGELVGGPMYYIEKGMGKKWLAVIFAIACIFSTLCMGNMTQANSIAGSLNESFNLDPRFTAIILSVTVSLIIFGGLNRIVNVSEKIVPLMAGFYITGGIIVILVNFDCLGKMISEIFQGAFSFNSVGAGTLGFITSNAIKYGISRGTFSNEAGLGSSPIIYAAVDEKSPVVQGMWGIFQVFFDTIIGCTITAFCILCSGTMESGKGGIALSAAAFESVFGNFGSYFVSISIVLFSFSTIIGWSYLGQRAFEYILGLKFVIVYKAIYVVMILFGSVMELNFVWELSDTFNGFMMIPNLIAIIILSNKIVKEWKTVESIRYPKKYMVSYKKIAKNDCGNLQSFEGK